MEKTKYPRTYHFHNSPNLQNDDRKLESYDGFYFNKRVETPCPFCTVCTGYLLVMECQYCKGRKLITHPSAPKTVIATLKLDGENTTMYSDHIHARSLDSAHHPSRTMIKQIHGAIKHLIPKI